MKNKRERVEIPIDEAISISVGYKGSKPQYMDIEAKKTGWKLQFRADTKEFAQIMYIIKMEDKPNLIKNLVSLLYTSRLIVSDPKFLPFYQKAVEDFFAATSKPAENTEEDDAEILEEQRKLHELAKEEE